MMISNKSIIIINEPFIDLDYENKKKIVLPEATDERVLRAARIATDREIANIVFLVLILLIYMQEKLDR